LDELKVRLIIEFNWFDNNYSETIFGKLYKDISLKFFPAIKMSISLDNDRDFYINHIKQNAVTGDLTLFTVREMSGHFKEDGEAKYKKSKKELLSKGWNKGE